MKKLFKNFSWSVMIAYTIVFGLVTLAFDFFWGDLAKHTIPLSQYLIGYFIKVLLFGFVMSLIFGKKIIKNAKDTNEKF